MVLRPTRAIRDHEADSHLDPVPVVALTAHVAGTSADAWKQAGMNDCIVKPFTMSSLIRCFETWCEPDPSVVQQPAALLENSQPDTGGTEPANLANALDASVLADIAEMGGSGGAKLLRKIFDLFKSSAPEALAAIKEAAAASDTQATASAAHALKSMSFNAGSLGLAALCGELEKNARSWGADQFSTQLGLIEAEFNRVILAMDDDANISAVLTGKAAA